jgi:hypothetical protein
MISKTISVEVDTATTTVEPKVGMEISQAMVENMTIIIMISKAKSRLITQTPIIESHSTQIICRHPSIMVLRIPTK